MTEASARIPAGLAIIDGKVAYDRNRASGLRACSARPCEGRAPSRHVADVVAGADGRLAASRHPRRISEGRSP